MEIFSRFDAFYLVSSNIALEQELFNLVENGFKSTEELMLENATTQLATAKYILDEISTTLKKVNSKLVKPVQK